LTDRIQHSITLKLTHSKLPAEQLAFILVTYIQGLFRVSNTYLEVEQLKTQTENFLQALNV